MRRAERLFRIVQHLRRRRLTTAAQLARRLEVSERTIYRDIADLIGSGVPIEGEAGVGYLMGDDIDLPPIVLETSEIQALVLGMRMVGSWGDAELRAAAASVLDKVEAVLPPAKRPWIESTALYAISFSMDATTRARLGELRTAIDARRALRIAYADAEGRATSREVCPLGLWFWGRTWTLGAWCELRCDHRNFRVDRIAELCDAGRDFEAVEPRTLEAYVRSVPET
jgi:predicted DNA-binding transcriptional regulator YafY